MDLDRFKIINDSLGHSTGDRLLVAVAQRLQSCIRPGDIVSRFGGDEFALLLDDIKHLNDATHLANRIQKELAMPFELGGHEVFTSASIGIAISTTGYDQAEDILRDADVAMYRAKSRGKARYEIFDTDMHANALKIMKLEADLRRAIERGEFHLLYQPIISLGNGRITGAEALIRWNHPEQGIILPADFIPLSEENGYITNIGVWALSTACRQNRVWQDSGFPDLLMKVNFSARQFRHKEIVKDIKEVLKETGVSPVGLDIEITESVATDEGCYPILKEMSDLGVRISIDDFGTGYSSLGALKNLPIDVVKIDRSFIRDMTTDSNDEAIVKAIIAMAHNLNLKVIAEGVETEDQRSFLKKRGCDEMQGFLFSRPVTAQQFTELLERERMKFSPASRGAS
jgi:diguanylate cyclase (GGDEF)-like protein